jgi:hypothetical protein
LAPPSVGRSRSLFNRSGKLAHGVSYFGGCTLTSLSAYYS